MNNLDLALEHVPEGPEQVIPRSILLHGTARILGSPSSGSFGIYDAERSTLALAGSPRPEDRLPASLPDLVIATAGDFETPAWPSFQWTPLDVFLFERGGLKGSQPSTIPSAIERLPPTYPVADINKRLRFAVKIGRSLGPVFVAREGADVVATACCFWRSQRFYDISIDTLPGHRRRGLGRAVANALIRDLEPASAVHCSSVDETLARRFIVSLGFRRVGTILRGIALSASRNQQL